MNKANCASITVNGKTFLKSYSSTVVIIDHDSKIITLGKDWEYSNTTARHIKAFFQEYGINANRILLNKALNEDVFYTVMGQFNVIYDSKLR